MNIDMPDLANQIRAKLTENAHGMFLWVALQMKTILRLTQSAIYKHIDNLTAPTEINQVYRDVMEELSHSPDAEKFMARRVLALLRHAGGPVAVGAVLEAMAVATDEDKMDQDTLGSLKKSPGSVGNMCKHLVALDENAQVFRFIHTSVYDYLIRDQWQHKLGLEKGGDGALLAEICLSYLCGDSLGGPIENLVWSNPAPLKRLFGKHPLMEFAAIHWVRHIWSGTSMPVARLLAFCQKSKNMLLAFQTFLFSVHVDLPMKVCPTHVVSYFHLFPFLDHLDDKRLLEPHAQASNGFAPLHWALQGRQGSTLDTAKKLIALKADINVQDSRGHTALYHASERGELDVVRELLKERRVKVNLRKKPYGTPLIVACSKGHVRIAEMLIDAGADMTATSELGTAIHAAASQNYVDCVSMLLERKQGRLWDKLKGPIGTPLHEAAYFGRHEVVRQLLGAKFRVDKISERYGSPLQAASSGCCIGVDSADFKQVFEALFESNADINARGGYYGTALLAAVEYGHEDLVEMLIDRGARLDISGPNGTAYQVACKMQYTKIMGLLERAGAAFNPTSNNVASKSAGSRTTDAMENETYQPTRDSKGIFDRQLALFLRALKHNDARQMEISFSAYMKGTEFGIKQKQDNLVQLLASIGEWVFRHVVSSIEDGRGVHANEFDLDTPSSVGIFPRAAQVVRKFLNRPPAPQDGQRSISQSYALPFDCTGPELQILDRFTQIAVSLLAYAIAEKNWKAVKILAKAWTSALELVRGHDSHNLFHVLFKARSDALQDMLSKNDHHHAGIMAQVSIQLVSMSLNRPGYKDLAVDIAQECVSALRDVERTKGQEVLSMLVGALFTEFEAGIHTGDDMKLQDCCQAVFEFMERMMDEGDDSLLSMVGGECATKWTEAINHGKGKLIDRIEKMASAGGHERVLQYIWKHRDE